MQYGTGLAFPSLTPAVKRLLIVNAAVFVLVALSLPFSRDALVGLLGFSFGQVVDSYGLGLLNLITYQFVHSPFGLLHIFFNMLMLYFFGTMAERRIGYLGMYKLYLVGGLVGGIVHALVMWMVAGAGGLNVAVIGASGSVYAVLVYAAMMAPHTMVIVIFIPVQLGILAGFLVLVGLYMLYLELLGVGSDGVSHGAHLGGALLGFLAFKKGWFRDWTPYVHQQSLGTRFRGWLRDRQERRRRRQRAEKQATLDLLLQKVHEHGIASLTPSERRFLERTSEELKDR